MKLELLPNEILLDIFEYFNSIDLLLTFSNLNVRFNFLLYNLFPFYKLQFNVISKRNFDMICQQHLPYIANRIVTLKLSNYRETPEQIDLFSSYIRSFDQLTNLRTMQLWQLRSYEILMKILDQCQHLRYFTNLIITFYSVSNTQTDYQLILNKIWSLPNLIRIYMNISINRQQIFYVPTTLSKSINSVTVTTGELTLNQINQLIDFTPYLKYLSISIRTDKNNDYVPLSLPTLNHLRICLSFPINIPQILLFFQNLHNLLHLNIRIYSELIDGQQWEHIIHNYLPKLKTFRLQMKQLSFIRTPNIQEQADRLLDSFRSSFWIQQHQWFVQCFIQSSSIHLYTASKQYRLYNNRHPISCKSTYPCDSLQIFYDKMTDMYDSSFFDKPFPSSDIRLPNINCLYIKLPINNQFWLIVPDLNQLKTLIVLSHDDTFQSQLQTLLDRASRLHSLTIKQDPSLPLQMSLFKYTSTSIRTVHLEDCLHVFNDEECLLLSCSPFAVQCEVLSIMIKTRESIILLIENMIHLRSISVKFKDDQYCQQSELIEDNDELIQWLKNHLPSTCLIVRDPDYNNKILIWI